MVESFFRASASLSASDRGSRDDVLVCYSFDLPGHGDAKGTRGYMRYPSCVDHALLAIQTVAGWHAAEFRAGQLEFHLAGSSFGGALAIAAALRVAESREAALQTADHGIQIRSLILVAPLVKIRDPPAAPVVKLLRLLAWVAPSLPLLSISASDPAQQYRDPERREVSVADPLQYNGKLRLGSAESCFLLTQSNAAKLKNLPAGRGSSSSFPPMLVLAAENETVVDGAAVTGLVNDLLPPGTGTQADARRAASKTHVCPEALHGIFCEPAEALEKVELVLAEWFGEMAATLEVELDSTTRVPTANAV
eukprot:g12247.t1